MALFMRALYFSFSYIINKALDVFLHYKFCAPCFPFVYLAPYQNRYCLTHTDNDSATASYDFESLINQAKDEGEDDCEVLGELA